MIIVWTARVLLALMAVAGVAAWYLACANDVGYGRAAAITFGPFVFAALVWLATA